MVRLSGAINPLRGLANERALRTGVTEIFYKVAAHALQVYGLDTKFVHLDSSSFHLHRIYDPEEPERQAISITYGYSKDHRPDLK